MRDTWLVKGYPYVLRRRNPTTADISSLEESTIWINPVSNAAFILESAAWYSKAPSYIIDKDIAGKIYVIDSSIVLVTSSVIQSEPDAAEYQITNLRVDGDLKIVITYNEDPGSSIASLMSSPGVAEYAVAQIRLNSDFQLILTYNLIAGGDPIGIISDPGQGEYEVTNMRLNASNEIILTYRTE